MSFIDHSGAVIRKNKIADGILFDSDEEGDDDSRKAKSLVFGQGDVDPMAELRYQKYRNELEEMHNQIERMDTNYTNLENDYFGQIASKAVEIENLDP